MLTCLRVQRASMSCTDHTAHSTQQVNDAIQAQIDGNKVNVLFCFACDCALSAGRKCSLASAMSFYVLH